MLAWEGHLAASLGRLRNKEVGCLARRKYLDALCVIFWAATPVLTSLATFVAVVYIDHDITPAAVFTTIALLQMLTFPLVRHHVSFENMHAKRLMDSNFYMHTNTK